MLRLRTLLAVVAAGLVPAASAQAVVGGTDAPAGTYPYVAEIDIDHAFLCTGTLVTPTYVVTAGHCSSITGAAGAGVPIGQPGQLITVTLGSNKAGQGTDYAVKTVSVNPNYNFLLNGSGYDVALLELATPATGLPTVKVAGRGEESLWKPGSLATIAGWGATSEGGDLPDTLQEAHVPIVDDATAAAAYSEFENKTQIGAGYPQGGTDTCQGDSGGPLLVPAPSGAFRLAGDTSYGDGCARPGKPGIYGRVGDATLREWIRSIAPDAVAPDATTTTTTAKKKPAGPRQTAKSGRAHATLR